MDDDVRDVGFFPLSCDNSNADIPNGVYLYYISILMLRQPINNPIVMLDADSIAIDFKLNIDDVLILLSEVGFQIPHYSKDEEK